MQSRVRTLASHHPLGHQVLQVFSQNTHEVHGLLGSVEDSLHQLKELYDADVIHDLRLLLSQEREQHNQA